MQVQSGASRADSQTSKFDCSSGLHQRRRLLRLLATSARTKVATPQKEQTGLGHIRRLRNTRKRSFGHDEDDAPQRRTDESRQASAEAEFQPSYVQAAGEECPQLRPSGLSDGPIQLQESHLQKTQVSRRLDGTH